MTGRLFALLLSFGLLAGPLYGQAERAAETPAVFERPALVQQYQETITPQDLAAHLYLFASDFFEGRETATPGQKLAAYYLASQYRKIGLEPKGTAAVADPLSPEAYFQPFTVYGQLLEEAQLEALADGEPIATSTFSPEYQSGNAVLAYGSLPEAEGSLVFAGYGIEDDALGYDDYAALQQEGIETSGKWLMLLGGEPLAADSTSLLPTSDGGLSRWSTTTDKLSTAFRSGPIRGILVVSSEDAGTLATRAARTAKEAGTPSRLSLSPNGTSRPVPPVYVISAELADRMLAPTGRTVAELRRTIDERLEPVVFAAEDVTVRSTIDQPVAPLETENVLAFIEGTDPLLKDEVLVISSHYDHEGIDYALPEGEDRIYNGADDDGSGTVTMLEIAEAFMAAKRDGYGPRRSILFLNVSAEEKGLLGSKYYADEEPVFPLDKTVTNLNIDMIGRFDPTHPTGSEDYVYIIGSNLISHELHEINERVNEVTGVDLELDERFNSRDDPNRFYARSDHWNFGKHGVPFIFFFTGTHEDYHQPGDEPEKVAYDRMARIGRLIFATAWQVANQDAPPAVTGTGFN